MENSLNELMADRANVIESLELAQRNKRDVDNKVKQYLIEHQMVEFFNVEWIKLSRMTQTEPDRMIKQRVWET